MAKAATVQLLVAAALLMFVSASLADQGTATYYTYYSPPPACYGYTDDEGTMLAAASESLWDNGAACGRMYQVSCAGGTNATPNPCKNGTTVTVKIVDYCPSPGCQATLVLPQQLSHRVPGSTGSRNGDEERGTLIFNNMEREGVYIFSTFILDMDRDPC